MTDQFVYEKMAEDGGWRVRMMRNGEQAGTIIKNSNSVSYEYFRGAHNYLSSSDQDKNLDNLKKKIEKSFQGLLLVVSKTRVFCYPESGSAVSVFFLSRISQVLRALRVIISRNNQKKSS